MPKKYIYGKLQHNILLNMAILLPW